MNVTLAIKKSKFVRVVLSAGLHECPHQLSFSAETRTRNDDPFSPPGNNASMHKKIFFCVLRKVNAYVRFECFEKIAQAKASINEMGIRVEKIE
jgi:hypothetical protein